MHIEKRRPDGAPFFCPFVGLTRSFSSSYLIRNAQRHAGQTEHDHVRLKPKKNRHKKSPRPPAAGIINFATMLL